MAQPILLKGYIDSFAFRGQQACLAEYPFGEFDINKCKPACKVVMPDSSVIALSKWSSPKRTRTYPFARIYDTYHHNGKVVTVIPIIKDEGLGERKNDTNLDRVNFITLSWMNLANVYIILAWYKSASSVNSTRISKQMLENEHVCKQIMEISHYKGDAHHWNTQHFENDFIGIYNEAVKAYRDIANCLGVELHSVQIHEDYLSRVRKDGMNTSQLDIEKFKQESLRRSRLSASAEVSTKHSLESLSADSVKGLFEVQNMLGGTYYLTCDELIFVSRGKLLIRESKNSTKSGRLPSMNDIKGGLFKLLLFSHIKKLTLADDPSSQLEFETQLKLTGRFRGRLELPATEQKLEMFLRENEFTPKSAENLQWLNRELSLLQKIKGLLEGNTDTVDPSGSEFKR